MPPPVKKYMGDKTIIQSYLDHLDDLDNLTTPEEGAQTPQDDLIDTEVQYFVDEEGRYYYQPAGDQSIVSLQNEVPVVNPRMVASDPAFQTVTLMPSENNQGEVSYVLVVQEENKPVLNIDIKNEQVGDGDGDDDVYHFEEDEEEAEEDSGEEKAPKEPKQKAKRAGRRPNFSCSFCTYTSHRRYLLLRHMKTHSEERPHMCSVCERGFKTQASLNNHLNMHNGVKPHICKYCQSTFTTSGELVRHVRYKHTHEKPHRCTECDYASVELSKLRRHVRCHTGERPYQCPHCTYASPDTFKLKRHLRTHTGEKPYKCTHCNMCFTQSNSLKSHRLIHNVADKPVYSCELCPAKCSRKTDLRIHIQKLHTSDIPLKCKRCGKSFPDRYSCKLHNKTHEGEKCFKCKLCPYASTTLRHLKSHMLKHTDEKPFSCTECDQSFRQKQLLRRHINLYHNPQYVPKPPKEKTHSCRECNRTFARKGNLIRHLAIHDPDSGHREHALALKLGRQKRIKIVDGQMKVIRDPAANEQDVIKLGMTNNELKRGELVTVADGDGQQYVVLEVIQLEDGTEQQVAVVAPDFDDDNDEDDEAEIDEDEDVMMEENPLEGVESAHQRQVENNIKLEREVTTCFGFDDDEEQDEDGTQRYVLSKV